jgi:hypothetical protein
MVFLATPKLFYAVGLYCADFSQTSDEEVMELLGRHGPLGRLRRHLVSRSDSPFSKRSFTAEGNR